MRDPLFFQISTLITPTSGLHAGFLLPAILDGSATGFQKATRRRDTERRLGVHQEHLGAGHVLRQREAVVLSRRHNQ